MLKLPSYRELSKEQNDIYNLPLDGTYLVSGPPGTGKTVLAIYRASMYTKAKKASQFLVYGRPLMQYLGQAIDEAAVRGSAVTFHKWFWDWYRRYFRGFPPQVKKFVFDWPAVYGKIARMQGLQGLKSYEHLIIDEGQDFPREFYTVMQLLSSNITVFADENQRLHENNSTLRDIRQYTRPKKEYRLTRNYRNSRQIAEFARVFYAGLEGGIPDLPERKGQKPRSLRAPNLDAQVRYVAKYEGNRFDRDIGLFVPSKDLQKLVFRKLQGNTKNDVEMYISGDQDHDSLNFHNRGIKILTYASAKGLEFDTVFIPALDTRLAAPTDDHEKMRFYVMTSRAREELYLMSSGTDPVPPLLRNVPTTLYDVETIR